MPSDAQFVESCVDLISGIKFYNVASCYPKFVLFSSTFTALQFHVMVVDETFGIYYKSSFSLQKFRIFLFLLNVSRAVLEVYFFVVA